MKFTEKLLPFLLAGCAASGEVVKPQPRYDEGFLQPQNPAAKSQATNSSFEMPAEVVAACAAKRAELSKALMSPDNECHTTDHSVLLLESMLACHGVLEANADVIDLQLRVRNRARTCTEQTKPCRDSLKLAEQSAQTARKSCADESFKTAVSRIDEALKTCSELKGFRGTLADIRVQSIRAQLSIVKARCAGGGGPITPVDLFKPEGKPADVGVDWSLDD